MGHGAVLRTDHAEEFSDPAPQTTDENRTPILRQQSKPLDLERIAVFRARLKPQLETMPALEAAPRTVRAPDRTAASSGAMAPPDAPPPPPSAASG